MMKGSDKLMKLKSLLKKLNSFNNKQSRPTSSSVAAASDIDKESSANLQPVYVGKSRRQYLISPDIIKSPLFPELAGRSTGKNDTIIIVSCKVVLFEHLIWMLENADPQAVILEKLVEFYANGDQT
ncbi:auxin-responsive protein SAUR76-like [Hibiscus syriacus]|uniref:auxin-responsive protein SAUR76-like n=1 Tax=Hibiscus syriacus TaxID=106335 RepID=UPI0019229F64|nr:auxin-responsive protein SAUR76-like [Hibiscus syriacus]